MHTPHLIGKQHMKKQACYNCDHTSMKQFTASVQQTEKKRNA